jgi:hypothetical protein
VLTHTSNSDVNTPTLSTNRYDGPMGSPHQWLHMTALWAVLCFNSMNAWATPDVVNTSRPDLVGTWYLRIRTATDARVPIIGNTHIQSTTHLLVSIVNNDGVLYQTQRTCIVDSRPSRSITKTVLPKAFIDHLPVKTYPVFLAEKANGAWSYSADLQQQYVGYDGKKANGVIPEDDDDPSVFDWDEDGEPGASVLIDIPLFGHIRIYMVQTNHTLLNGQLLNDNRIEGHSEQLVLDQRTIGADNRLLTTSPKLSVGKGHDRFEMMRIEDDATCTDIRRLGAGTF